MSVCHIDLDVLITIINQGAIKESAENVKTSTCNNVNVNAYYRIIKYYTCMYEYIPCSHIFIVYDIHISMSQNTRICMYCQLEMIGVGIQWFMHVYHEIVKIKK